MMSIKRFLLVGVATLMLVLGLTGDVQGNDPYLGLFENTEFSEPLDDECVYMRLPEDQSALYFTSPDKSDSPFLLIDISPVAEAGTEITIDVLIESNGELYGYRDLIIDQYGVRATNFTPDELSWISYPTSSEGAAFTLDMAMLRNASDREASLSVQFTFSNDAETASILSCFDFHFVLLHTPVASTFIPVVVDIKPGTDPNSINLGSSGKLPVAIFSSSSFDATTIDPATLILEDANVAERRNGTLMVSAEDVDGHGRQDLVAHVRIAELGLDETDEWVILSGETYGGDPVVGGDLIRIVPSR